MSKKDDKTKESKSDFDLDVALSNVNRYLLLGFKEFIKDEKVTTQKQFDKLYNDYKEFR
jgi:hypothetical protein